MSTFQIPAEGLPLSHDQLDPKEPHQIIRIDLNERISRDLLKAAKSDEPVRIRFGRKPGLTIGTKNVSLLHGPNKFPQEIFSGPFDGREPVCFSGKLSLTLETQHAREITAGVDHALNALKSNLKSAQDERNASEPNILNNRLLKPLHKPSPLAAGLVGSRPSSPFLSGLSPRPAPTSAPMMSSLSKRERIKLDAIKIPVIHLLAVEPRTPQALSKLLRVKQSDLDRVLEKVARPGKEGKELKDRAYRDLDVWNFPYQSQNDRQAAIDHAISAYDRLRVEKTDNLWQMLLAKEDRGKGIFLSKLNFDKPLLSGNMTPKLTERSADGGSTEGKSMTSDQSNKKGKVPIAKLTDPLAKTKPAGESKPKPPVTKDPLKLIAAASKEAKKAQAQSQALHAKQDVKYKSTAKVQGSEEETDAALSRSARPTSSLKRPYKEAVNDKASFSDQKASAPRPLTSSKPSSSLLLQKPQSATSNPDRTRLIPSTMAKTRSGADTSRSQNTNRPRNGSSPAKPSPLGSSPPTNSRDVDTTSNSSKGSSQSSAPSSPPSSADLSHAKNNTYSPVIAEKKLDKTVNGLGKRKAESNAEQPPAKRQQVKESDADHRQRVNDHTQSPTEEGERKPQLRRQESDTDVSSSSDGLATKQMVINEARHFQTCWNKYKELHDRLSKQRPADIDDKDLERLWKMHSKLKTRKEQIWKDWDRIEKDEAASK